MQPFETNRHGRIVFPSNFFPDIDFSTVTDVEQLDSVIRRDFDTKAPTASEILARHTRGDYRNKVELLRDVALNAYWANRFALTMFDKRPTRWADVPRTRDDLYMPVLTPWPDQESKVAEVEAAFRQLPAGWDDAAEDCIFETVFDVFAARKHVAGALP
ncbi:3-ketoacyl-ACP synthase, partial [Rhodococcus rhodochrous KG-21]